MKQLNKKYIQRRKHIRIKSKLKISKDRVRLSVFRSHRHIYAQIIDDINGVTYTAASTLDKSLNLKGQDITSNCESANKVGQLLGEKALNKGIQKVVFDRGGYIYHGRVKALAEGARTSGLKF